MLSALEALERLRAGNRRFVEHVRAGEPLAILARPGDVATRQAPFAVILGCSDSRVPAELVFGQGLGDLFVIRVAGNTVAPSQVGSIEFAASRFGTRLVVVLGHSGCGAVQATLDALEGGDAGLSTGLRSIVEAVRPAVEAAREAAPGGDRDALVRHAVRGNIRASAGHLRHGSRILEEEIRAAGLVVVGAEYSLETGVVEFFDGVPAGQESGR